MPYRILTFCFALLSCAVVSLLFSAKQGAYSALPLLITLPAMLGSFLLGRRQRSASPLPKVPGGIRLIAFFFRGLAYFTLLMMFTLLVLAYSGPVDRSGPPPFDNPLVIPYYAPPLATGLLIAAAVYALAFSLFAVGTLLRQRHRLGYLVAGTLSALIFFFELISSTDQLVFLHQDRFDLPGLAVFGGMLIYLVRPSIEALFPASLRPWPELREAGVRFLLVSFTTFIVMVTLFIAQVLLAFPVVLVGILMAGALWIFKPHTSARVQSAPSPQ